MKLANILSLIFFLCSQAGAEEKIPKKCDACTFWAEAKYLCWWIKDSPVPPLLVDDSLGILLASASDLDLPSESLVLGGKDIDIGARSGGRVEAGGWFNDTIGLAGSYLFLPAKSKAMRASSSGQIGSVSLVLPYIDAMTGAATIVPISFTGLFAGRGSLRISNTMQSAEADILTRIYCRPRMDILFLSGFQWWNFNENLTFKTSSPSIVPPFYVFRTEDDFKTRNHFYGAVIGFDASFMWSWFRLETVAKAALGVMHSSVNINGELVTNYFSGGVGPSQKFPAGYFALPTNEGTSSRNCFSAIPEVDVNLGFQIIKALSFEIGYTFLYVAKVLWTGNTIDQTLNTSQAPAITFNPSTTLVGVARPKPLFKREGFWVQGLNIGLKFCY